MPTEKTAEQQKALPHNVILEGRSRLTVTGVLKVLRCDEFSASMETTLGILNITGSGLSVSELSLSTGEVRVGGKVEALNYEELREPGGFLRRLAR